LPSWLSEAPATPQLAGGRRRRRGFLEKTLAAIAETIRNELFAEELARRPGLLQGIDPRVKLATVLLLIGVAGLLHHPATLLIMHLWLLWLARASRVPLATFAKRVWIVVPLFTGIVVLPVLFNVVRPGTPLVTLVHFGHPWHLGPWSLPATLAVTREGALAALLLVLRVGASVSLAVLLTLTTRWSVLLKALSVLRIPGVFLAVLEMTYRYVFLLLVVSSEIFTARKSRLVGRTTTAEERRFVTAAMGSLWGKTHATAEEVHQAMLARGYSGEPRALDRFRLQPSDGLWLAIVVLVAALLIGGDHVLR
jgi:cobalt/nickel transport system permease protein